VKWPHDTPGAPAAGENRPYPDGSRYIQPQLAPAGAIDVTSRPAPRPTGGPITQRETQRPADGFPNAESVRDDDQLPWLADAYRSSRSAHCGCPADRFMRLSRPASGPHKGALCKTVPLRGPITFGKSVTNKVGSEGANPHSRSTCLVRETKFGWTSSETRSGHEGFSRRYHNLCQHRPQRVIT